jgi:hypothetical protein
MMAFTADGQVNRKLVEKRDADYGVSMNIVTTGLAPFDPQRKN